MGDLYRICSFDVGIKNLAFCVINFNKETNNFHSIENWGLINLKSDAWIPDHNEKKCGAEVKSGAVCGKMSNCWVVKEGKRVEMCRMHSKLYEKSIGPIVKTERNEFNQNPEKLNFEFFPYELKDLKCYCGEKSRKFFIKIITPESTSEVVHKNNLENIKIAGFCNKCGKIREKDGVRLEKISDYMRDDDTKIYTRLYEGLGNLNIETLNEVVIENQPALKNPRMKSIQMFIYSFFFINGKNGLIKNMHNVGFFSATKKLNPTMIVADLVSKKNGEDIKVDEVKKKVGKKKLEEEEIEEEPVSEYQAYKKRKNDSVAIVTEILQEMEEWKKYFVSHPKKDDLADSLLQGIAQWSMHSSKNLSKKEE